MKKHENYVWDGKTEPRLRVSVKIKVLSTDSARTIPRIPGPNINNYINIL
jgi:hypothetical protein